MRGVILTLFVAFVPLIAIAAESEQPVFVREHCDGKLSSVVFSSFREAIRASQKYQSVPTLENEGRLGRVFAIYMVCTERSDFAAIATTYGKGGCVTNKKCGVTVDGSSLKLALCDSYAVADCGRALFKRFDDYVSGRVGAPPN